MADQRLRDLERSYQASGTVEDHAALLRGQVRAGLFSEDRLRLYAFRGDAGAVLAVGDALPTAVEAVRLAWTGIEIAFEFFGHADHLASLRPPASEVDLQAYEEATGRSIPLAARASWLIHDGQDESGRRASFPDFMRLYPAGEALKWWQGLDALRFDNDYSDEEPDEDWPPQVQHIYWHAGWLPYATNHMGEELYVDTDPTKLGVHGQLLEMTSEADVTIIATGVDHYLVAFALGLWDGTHVCDPESRTFLSPEFQGDG